MSGEEAYKQAIGLSAFRVKAAAPATPNAPPPPFKRLEALGKADVTTGARRVAMATSCAQRCRSVRARAQRVARDRSAGRRRARRHRAGSVVVVAVASLPKHLTRAFGQAMFDAKAEGSFTLLVFGSTQARPNASMSSISSLTLVIDRSIDRLWSSSSTAPTRSRSKAPGRALWGVVVAASQTKQHVAARRRPAAASTTRRGPTTRAYIVVRLCCARARAFDLWRLAVLAQVRHCLRRDDQADSGAQRRTSLHRLDLWHWQQVRSPRSTPNGALTAPIQADEEQHQARRQLHQHRGGCVRHAVGASRHMSARLFANDFVVARRRASNTFSSRKRLFPASWATLKVRRRSSSRIESHFSLSLSLARSQCKCFRTRRPPTSPSKPIKTDHTTPFSNERVPVPTMLDMRARHNKTRLRWRRCAQRPAPARRCSRRRWSNYASNRRRRSR